MSDLAWCFVFLVEFVASGYGLTVEQVEAVVAHWHGKRLRKAVHA